jgi:hypothetical protein
MGVDVVWATDATSARLDQCSRSHQTLARANGKWGGSEKVGKWFIQLCGTTPCMVNGAEEIRATIEKHVGIKEGGEWVGVWVCGLVLVLVHNRGA